MLDKTKVINGPFNLVLLAGEVEKFKLEGLKKDSVAFSVEPQSEDIEDGSKDLYAYLAKADVTFSQLDTTDLGNIQDPTIDSVEIRFTVKGKKIVISAPTNIIPSIDSLKTKIAIEKLSNTPNIADAFDLEAIV